MDFKGYIAKRIAIGALLPGIVSVAGCMTSPPVPPPREYDIRTFQRGPETNLALVVFSVSEWAQTEDGKVPLRDVHSGQVTSGLDLSGHFFTWPATVRVTEAPQQSSGSGRKRWTFVERPSELVVSYSHREKSIGPFYAPLGESQDRRIIALLLPPGSYSLTQWYVSFLASSYSIDGLRNVYRPVEVVAGEVCYIGEMSLTYGGTDVMGEKKLFPWKSDLVLGFSLPMRLSIADECERDLKALESLLIPGLRTENVRRNVLVRYPKEEAARRALHYLQTGEYLP